MRHVSIKLLRVFVLLMEYRDLNAVAACTQGRVPTVAYSLARLREITGDPLFLKRNGTLEPTPHALRLEPTARQILTKWANLMRPPEQARSALRTGKKISIGFSPSIGDPVITEILTTLCEQFPADRFITRPVLADAALATSLEQGELDCAFVVDTSFAPEHIALHSLLATPRRLLSATRPGSEDTEADSDWILLQEDSEAGSPMRNFLSRHSRERGYRETVVPSWHTQIALLHAAGGICSLLDFNVPLVTREKKTRLMPPPSTFPEWAALHFWMPAETKDKAVLRDVRDVGAAVLQHPLKAIEARTRSDSAAAEFAAA